MGDGILKAAKARRKQLLELLSEADRAEFDSVEEIIRSREAFLAGRCSPPQLPPAAVPRQPPANDSSKTTKTALIVEAAAKYLALKNTRALAREIATAISGQVEIGGKDPASIVSAYLSSSPLFDNDRAAGGYGLAAWKNVACTPLPPNGSASEMTH